MRTKAIQLIGSSLIIFLLAVSGWAEEREYPGVFDGLILSVRSIERVKTFDEWAFQDEQRLFIGLGPDKAYPRVLRTWYLGFERGDEFVSENEGMLSSTTFFSILRRGRNATEANVLVLAIAEINEKSFNRIKSSLEQFFGGSLPTNWLDSLTHDAGENCALFRKLSASQAIEKSLIVVKPRWRVSTLPEARREGISCINKGFYYHLGFSNVLKRNSSEFAIPAPSSPNDQFIMNWDTVTPPNPPFIRRGDFTGFPRVKVLRAIAEHEAKKHD